MQFNVLADGLSGLNRERDRFSRVNSSYLDWQYRRTLLLEEISQYNPDVITMQEVDHYYDFFWPYLHEQGYIGYFAPKPTSACLETGNADGCAMFLKKSKFRVISCETKTLALSKAELTDTGELKEDQQNIMAQNQVALIVVCELLNRYQYVLSKPSAFDGSPVFSPPIIIGTTHLKSVKSVLGERHRKRGISQVLGSLSKIATSYVRMGRPPAIILTGDFNAIAEKCAYEPLAYQTVKDHPFGLRSVYNEDVPLSPSRLSSTDLYTTWKARWKDGQEVVFKRCIDYIFYQPFKSGNLRAPPSFPMKDSLEEKSASSTAGGGGSGPVVVNTYTQVAISSLLRFSVYIFLLFVPMTAAFSSQISAKELTELLSASLIFLFVFEVIADGSVFKPYLWSVYSTPEKITSETRFFTSVASISQQIQPLPEFDKPGFQAVRALDLLSEEEVGPALLPSASYPSDHLAILADLELLW
eukprot:gene3759-4108_t